MKMIKQKCRNVAVKVKTILRDMLYFNFYYRKEIAEKTVLLEASHGKVFEGNIFYLAKEISENYPDYTVYVSVTTRSKKNIEKVLKKYNLSKITLVSVSRPKYLKVLATAKYLFNDTTFLPFFVKKEGQIYVNTWHGTPLKTLGYDILSESRHVMGNLKRNLIFSDYIVCPSKEMQQKFFAAYGIQNLYKGKVLNAGYPRNEVFFDRDKEQTIRNELGLEDKNVIVYMPTWRDYETQEEEKSYLEKMAASLKSIDSQLTDKDVLFVKLHVLARKGLDLSGLKHIQFFPEDYEPYEVLNTADTLVTDYSSVFFDFANTKKKIILFVDDFEEYARNRGMYYTMDELPFPKVDNVEDLMFELRKEKDYDDADFLSKFCPYDKAHASRDLLRYVLLNEKSDSIEMSEVQGNGRLNTYLYVGALGIDGLTSSALALVDAIDRDEENLYLSFQPLLMLDPAARMDKLPIGSLVFPLEGKFRYSALELIASILFFTFNKNSVFTDKYIDRMYAREARRFFGGAHFDRVIHFTGYGRNTISLLQRMKSNMTSTAIFVHSNMIEEVSLKGNQHLLTLKSAYNNYDKVAAVSEAMITPTKEISGRDDNIVVVNNALNYKKIHDMAARAVSFDESTLSNVDEATFKAILDSDCVKFISVGRFSPEKGYERLVDAYERFYQECKNSYLILIGGRGEYEDILQQTSRLSCKDRVVVIKGMSNPFAVVKRCDLFVLSSFYEAFNMALWEASILAVPVVSVDILGVREFMLENNGTLVENSEDGILTGMKSFISGDIKPMKFDAKLHNEKVKQHYEAMYGS